MTGEKISIVPIEITIKPDANVEECIVFGSARSQAGTLILLSEKVEPNLSREAILALISPTVELANTAAPSHARLTVELLILLPSGTPIPRADKGSFIRRKFYAEFKNQINQAYTSFEGIDGRGAKAKKMVRTVEEMEVHIFTIVKDVLGTGEGLEKDTDLFTYGFDSFAAGSSRNALQRNFDLKGHILSSNCV